MAAATGYQCIVLVVPNVGDQRAGNSLPFQYHGFRGEGFQHLLRSFTSLARAAVGDILQWRGIVGCRRKRRRADFDDRPDDAGDGDVHVIRRKMRFNPIRGSKGAVGPV